MKAKSLAIAALGVAVPPFGMAYLGYSGLNSFSPGAGNMMIFPHLTFIGFAMNVIFTAAIDLGTSSFYKPDSQIAYSTSEITVRYNAKDTTPKLLLGEQAVNWTTSYGFIEPFFRDRTYSPVTELSVTASRDYSCQWSMDGHVPLDTILEGAFQSSEPDVLLKDGTKATNPYIVDHARQMCRAVLAKESRMDL